MKNCIMHVAHVSVLTALSFLATGCGDDQDPSGAKELWDRIQAADYRNWDRAPGYAGRSPTNAPHSDAVEIFVNATVTAALAGPAITSWPDGSLIVKDGYDNDGTLDIVAAMEKRGSTWFWVEWQEDGSADYSGDPDICTNCHGSGADQVRAFGFPK